MTTFTGQIAGPITRQVGARQYLRSFASMSAAVAHSFRTVRAYEAAETTAARRSVLARFVAEV